MTQHYELVCSAERHAGDQGNEPKRSRYARLSPEFRVTLAHRVLAKLPVADQALALQYKAREIKMKYSKSSSPVVMAIQELQEAEKLLPEEDRQISGRDVKSFAETAKKWFLEYFSRPVTQEGEPAVKVAKTLQDAPRRGRGKVSLLPHEWSVLRDALTRWRWRDEAGNLRRFPSLEEAIQTKSQSAAGEQQAQQLQQIRIKSRVSNWKHLEEATVQHFNLTANAEVFKKPRQLEWSKLCARRMLGVDPQLEYYRSTRSGQGRAHKIKTVRLANGEEWQWDRSHQQLWGCVDGFTVHLRVEPKQCANVVYLEPGELLPVYDAPNVQGQFDAEKQYYMAITFPGYGVLAVVALKSASRLVQKRKKGTAPRLLFKYWFQQLKELGILPADRPNLEEELAARDWKVCIDAICLLITSVACGIPA